MAILGFGKHPIVEVIKYDGPNDVLIWKHFKEDFNTNARLVVGPAQEAIFVKEGQVLGKSVPGTYTLNTKNYPFIRSLVEIATGGVSPFSCSIYFVNKVVSMGIDWGTDTPISVRDPVYHVPVDIRSYGDLSLRVENGQMLLEKLVGQTIGFSQQEVIRYFSNLISTKVRGIISGTMMTNSLSAIGIDAYLPEMSKYVAEQIGPIFEPYGLTVNHFTIAAITASDLDPIKETDRDLQKQRMKKDMDIEFTKKSVQAKAFENRELGISEQQKIVGRALETIAANSGPMTGVVGGVGMPFHGVVGGSVVQPSSAGSVEMSRMILSSQPKEPAQDFDAATPGDTSRDMGRKREKAAPQTPAPAAQESFEQRAMKVKFLLDNGLITSDQYQEKISQLMNEI